MRRASVTAAVVTAFAALAAAAWAQHGHGGTGAPGHQAAQACLTEFEQVVGEGRASAWPSPPTRTATPARCTCSS
jgi:hypothetical protein